MTGSAKAMGYHDNDPAEFAESDDSMPLSQQVLAVLVRLVGVAVLAVGLWVGVKVVLEAWALYEQPERIERFATAIQQGSNIDGLIGNMGAGGDEDRQGSASGESNTLRLSYFAAWLIALLLMFVIGSLAMAAITTGGQLALYDLQIRHHSRAVMREVRRLRRVA